MSDYKKIAAGVVEVLNTARQPDAVTAGVFCNTFAAAHNFANSIATEELVVMTAAEHADLIASAIICDDKDEVFTTPQKDG